MTSTTALATSSVLGRARRAKIEENRAAAEGLAAAVEWAALHETTEDFRAATWGGTPVPLAGEGAPLMIAEAVAEFAAVVGLSPTSGQYLFSQALELAHRLPKVYDRIVTGSLPAWRGRKIAAETLGLSPDAVAYVDAQIAPFAHKTSPAETQRLIETAIATFMPEYAKKRLEDAAENRHFSINHDQVSFAGTSSVWGELDLADALDLDAVISAEASALKDLGSEQPLDVRRATAVGNLARGQLSLALEPSAPRAAAREVVVHVHLDPDSEVARVENAGTHLVTKEQVAAWTGITGTRTVIRPVIDLVKPLSTSAYEVPDRIREHLVLRDKTCVFPHCSRRARCCDADHIHPYDHGGETSTDNLASLCRLHHRLKTHHGWTYTALDPGVFLWRSPHGYQFLRDHTGTELVTPDPPDPPAPPDG